MFQRFLKAINGMGKPSAAEATARGQEAMKSGDLQEAVKHFSAAVACDPTNPILIYNRGFAYLEAGELELARADFDRVIELTPEDPDPYVRRGLCSKQQGNLVAAVKDFTRAIKLQPEKSRHYNYRGVCLRDLGELDKAMADFDQAVKVDPENARAHANRAVIFEDRGQPVEAIQALTQSLELDPSDPNDWNRRGIQYDQLGKSKRAIADYTQALRLRPESAVFYSNRASSLGDAGRIQDALGDYQKSMRLDPALHKTPFGRGWLYATAKDAELGLPDFERGLADFELAVAIDPQFGPGYGGQSYCLARLGRQREAFKAAEQEIALSRPEGLRSRGHVKIITGDYEAGFTDLKEAFRLQPEKASLANQIAWMRATLSDPRVRNPAEALHYAKIACRLTSNQNWTFLDTMAGALAEVGRWEEAVALQEKVVAAFGNSSPEHQAHLDNYRNRRPTRNEYCDL